MVLRALLDGCAQNNFIMKRAARKLALPQMKTSLTITGIVDGVEQRLNRAMSCELRAIAGDFTTRIKAVILPKYEAHFPGINIDISSWRIPLNIRMAALADPEFNVARPIDLILNADCFYRLLSVGQIQLGKGKPVLQKTQLGWIVAGETDVGQSETQSHRTLTSLSDTPASTIED